MPKRSISGALTKVNHLDECTLGCNNAEDLGHLGHLGHLITDIIGTGWKKRSATTRIKSFYVRVTSNE